MMISAPYFVSIRAISGCAWSKQIMVASLPIGVSAIGNRKS